MTSVIIEVEPLIVLRAAHETDRARIEAMHRACSLESRIGRWHAPLRAVPARHLDDALSGRPGHMCALAFDGGELVGFASAVRGFGDRWDLGVLVRDDRQRQGVGSQLIDRAVQVARARGATSLGADLRPDRRFLLDVLGRHGCVVARSDGDGIHADVLLSPAGPVAAGTVAVAVGAHAISRPGEPASSRERLPRRPRPARGGRACQG